MNQYFDDLIVPTEGFSMHSITRDVEKIVSDSGLSNGLCQLSVLHTSASLLIQENASSDLQRDMRHRSIFGQPCANGVGPI